MWNINVNATYYDYANMICDLVVMKDCNNDTVLNKEECNAVFIFQHNIICFLTAVSYMELYNLLNMYMSVDSESE